MAPNVMPLPAYNPCEDMVKQLAVWLTEGERKVKVITSVNTSVNLVPVKVRNGKHLLLAAKLTHA